MAGSQHTEVAIVGVGASDYSQLYAERHLWHDAHYLATEALKQALDESGVDRDDIDGLICTRLPAYTRMGSILGLPNPKIVHSLEGSGRMSAVAVQHAVAMIRAGMATTVACVYGNNGKSARETYGGEGDSPTGKYDEMYGMTSPGAYVAMMWRRYQHLFGAPDGALAPVAINNRRNASLNPHAVLNSPITEEQYMSSRFIAEPLRLLDYCIITDGGAALIVTTMDRARTYKQKPVRIAATASLAELDNFYTSRDFFYSSCQHIANALYEESGLKPSDMDALQLYDNFTPTILFQLEGMGHCKQGEAWELVKNTSIGFDGDLPINTSGGHTGEAYIRGGRCTWRLCGSCAARRANVRSETAKRSNRRSR